MSILHGQNFKTTCQIWKCWPFLSYFHFVWITYSATFWAHTSLRVLWILHQVNNNNHDALQHNQLSCWNRFVPILHLPLFLGKLKNIVIDRYFAIIFSIKKLIQILTSKQMTLFFILYLYFSSVMNQNGSSNLDGSQNDDTGPSFS